MKPKAHEQFSELKRGLAEVTEDEWMNIPEPGDLRAVGRKRKRVNERERFTAAPDSLLLAARAQSQLTNSIDAQSGLVSSLSSVNCAAGADTPLADFRQISKARDDLLKVKLDQAGSNVDSARYAYRIGLN